MAFLSVQSLEAWACAGCRNPSLPVARGGQGPLPGGALSLQATLSATVAHAVHAAGCEDLANCDESPPQPTYQHDQRLYPVELRLGAEYALDANYGLELQLPIRSVSTSIQYQDALGQPYEPVDAGNHHRNETVVGLADPWLLLRIGTLASRFWLAARAGVSVPLGRTEADPFELGEQGERHQHIQMGTGTWDPVLVLELYRRQGQFSWGAFAQGQMSLYQNSYGYQAPYRLYAGAQAGTSIGQSFRWALGIHGLGEGQERWQGAVQQDGNLGRTEVLAALQLALTTGETDVSLTLRAPIYRHIVSGEEAPGRYSSPLSVALTVSELWPSR